MEKNKCMTNNLKASIVITTKNRKEELKKAIDSCIMLNGNPEIFIFDDGSEDGTFQFVKSEYSNVKIHREKKSIGLIDARTKAASLVSGDIIFSIDDDACFSDVNCITNILAFFNHPRIAAVSIPYIDIFKSNKIYQKGFGKNDDIYICSEFRGTAHALRKDIFLKLGGYRKNLERQAEELDYAIRLYRDGYIIRVGESKPILHYESPVRNFKVITFYAARNNLMIAWLYTPLIFIIPYITKLLIRLLYVGFNRNCIFQIISGVLEVFRLITKGKIEREALSVKGFVEYKKLRRKGVMKLADSQLCILHF